MKVKTVKKDGRIERSFSVGGKTYVEISIFSSNNKYPISSTLSYIKDPLELLLVSLIFHSTRS